MAGDRALVLRRSLYARGVFSLLAWFDAIGRTVKQPWTRKVVVLRSALSFQKPEKGSWVQITR